MQNNAIWLPAAWPAPASVRAGTTLRHGPGHDSGNDDLEENDPYAGFNLATHVGAAPDTVEINRRQLIRRLNLPAPPLWLGQVHGGDVLACCPPTSPPARADGRYAAAPGQVCVVLTADCLPLLLCNRQGNQVAAVHVGWRGLCQHIITRALRRFTGPVNAILAWLGPHICQRHYEVGPEVLQACTQHIGDVSQFLHTTRPAHACLDLGGLVRALLMRAGVSAVYRANRCTFGNQRLFYSYRRAAITGRMASLIWIES